jgi:hypothetical protein
MMSQASSFAPIGARRGTTAIISRPPATGIRPRTGRYENLSAVSFPQHPAQTYRRSWSNNWAVQHLYAASVQPLLTGDDNQPGTHSGSRHRPYAHGPHRIHKH